VAHPGFGGLKAGVRRLLACVVAAIPLGLFACAPAVEPTAPAAAHSEPLASGFEGGLRTIEATGQGLELSLPDAAGWRHDPRQRATWVATHAATGSILLARSWRADEIARPEDCEREMRLWRPDLPVLRSEERLESRQVSLAGGYVASFTTAARATAAPGRPVLGHAQLFGSDGRACVCLAFSTSARGADAARAVGDRLAVVSHLVFERARRIGIDARLSVPRR
jgi:hypothetical protein